MTDLYVSSGWCCVDCLACLANGEAPPDWSPDQVAAWLAEISHRNAGYDVTPGMPREQHDCLDDQGQTASDRGSECDCEFQSFTWSSCDVCGSNLGGQRHAVSWFTRQAATGGSGTETGGIPE